MKKTGFIILAVVLALGALGVGFASTVWSQNLNINGTASVATFQILWTHGDVVNSPTANSTTVLSAPIASPGTYNVGGSGGIAISITNAVPGVYTIPNVVLTNNSTIPLTMAVVAYGADGVNTLMPATWVTGLPSIPPTLDAGAHTVATDIVITIPDDAAQKTTYGFVVGITGSQN